MQPAVHFAEALREELQFRLQVKFQISESLTVSASELFNS